MSNRITFTLGETEHNLLFGMTSAEIYQRLAVKLAIEFGEKEKEAEPFTVENSVAFNNIVYAGLCNYADRMVVKRPTFQEAYDISEEIMYDDDLQNKVYQCFTDSQPIKKMMEKVTGISSETKKKKKPTGTK